jgi:hypothetical protein
VGPLRLTPPVPNASQGLGRLVSLRQAASRTTQEGGGRSVKAHSHAFPSRNICR